MTIKEELNEMRELDRYVAGLAIVIADMRNTLTAMDYSEVRVQATNACTDLSALIAKIEAYNRELEEEVDKLLEKRRALKAEVTAVLSGIQLQVIILRYFSMNYTWENIADILGCSHQNVIQIHGRAIEKLNKRKKTKKKGCRKLQRVARELRAKCNIMYIGKLTFGCNPLFCFSVFNTAKGFLMGPFCAILKENNREVEPCGKSSAKNVGNFLNVEYQAIIFRVERKENIFIARTAKRRMEAR